MKPRASVLIVGGGRLQLPALHAAAEMGLRVVLVDRDPQAPGMALADAAHVVDTHDTAGAIAVAKREHVAGVLTLCTDYPVRTVAAVARALNLPGLAPATALRATHKGRMREAFAAGGAPSVDFRVVRDLAGARAAAKEIRGRELILKPAEASGSRGVYRIGDVTEIETAFAHAQSVAGVGQEMLVEQFVPGPEVSVEVVSWNGEHHIIAITDKRTTGAPYWVEVGHVQPSRLDHAVQTRIGDAARRGLAALGVDNSASHVEVRVGPDGPVLIEVGARLGGDYISTELTYRSTGVRMARAAVQLALGDVPDVTPQWQRAAAIGYLTARPGTVAAVRGLEEARGQAGICAAEVYVGPGSRVGVVRSSNDRAGHVIAEAETATEAEERCARAAATIQVLLVPD